VPGNLSADAYAALRRLLDVIEQRGAIGDLGQVFQIIEEDLRARMAVPIAYAEKPTENIE